MKHIVADFNLGRVSSSVSASLLYFLYVLRCLHARTIQPAIYYDIHIVAMHALSLHLFPHLDIVEFQVVKR